VRDWWLRTVLVLAAPRPVFVALRDESEESVADRNEPVLAIVLLAGMAFALASNAAGNYRGVDLAVWTFVAGSITGVAAYWALGAVLYGASRALGSVGSYRRSRHVLAFASVPLALSLLLSPIGLHRFAYALTVFGAWAAVVLVIGVKAVHGWTWPRALAAALPTVVLAAVLAAT
jgi:hypothetical protein